MNEQLEMISNISKQKQMLKITTANYSKSAFSVEMRNAIEEFLETHPDNTPLHTILE